MSLKIEQEELKKTRKTERDKEKKSCRRDGKKQPLKLQKI
jgi:hypothetical protein